MRKSNVLFIVPPVIPIEDLKRSNVPSLLCASVCSIPIGLLSIAAYVSKYAGAVNFNILDFNIETSKQMEKFKSMLWDDFLIEILSKVSEDQHPDIIGISAIFNSNAGYLHSISVVAKKICPEALVVTGGGLPTNMYTYVLDSASAIDAVAIGEGEKPFLELVMAEDRLGYLATGCSWMTRERARLKSVPAIDMVQDLDEIPFLRYDLIDFKEYHKRSRYHGERINDDISVSIMTSRGCPYRCSFCASHSVHGRRMRYYSPRRILTDIRKLKDRYGVKVIIIEDDNFFANKTTAMRVLEYISDEDMIIEFPNGLSIMHLDEEIIDALKLSGLKMASLAVESGNERVLKDIIHKPYTDLSRVGEIVSLLRKKQMYIRAFFIIGFPGETKEELLETISFMKKTGFNWVAIMIATPIAGSELYEICKEKNLLLSDKIDDFHYGRSNIKLAYATPGEIERLRYLTNLEVNFVENYDLRSGYPEIALIGFQDVINRVHNHAFAHYYASVCYKILGKSDLERHSLNEYHKVVNSSKDWMEYAKYFNLPFPDNITSVISE